MNEHARRMMMHRGSGGGMPEEMGGGNKYFIYRDGNDMRDGRGDYGDMRDGRNPYGSRGGYVDSMPYDMAYDNRRDMSYRDMNDMNYGGGRDMMYGKRDMQDGYSDGNYGRDYASGYGDRYGEKPYGRPDYRYDSMADERHGQRDYGYGDYHSSKLTKKDIKKWEKELENADGTMGKKYSKDQIMPIAQQLGIKFSDYTEDELVMAANMLYSDYCKVFGGDMTHYVKAGKAFLEDDDFDGTGSEKLSLYYRCIVEKGKE